MELARIQSLSNNMEQAGFQPMLFEDFAEETFTLLRKLLNAMASGTAEDVLWEAFNDDMLQNYIITHLRVSLSLQP